MEWRISAAELRDRFNQNTRTGNASGKTQESVAKTETASTNAAAPSTSGMSAMDTARASTRSVSLESTTSAKLTPSHSNGFTVWTESPIGYAERGCPKITDAEKLALGPQLAKLEALATGRNETIEQTIGSIVAFFVNVDSPWLEASLGDVLRHYLDNFIL